MADVTPPYVAAAVFCEQALEEKDGVMSLIRIVDRFAFRAEVRDAPDPMPPIALSVVASIAFKSGEYVGSRTLVLRANSPSATVTPIFQIPVQFHGGTQGIYIKGNLSIRFNTPGVHWIDVLLDDELKTRMPIEILHERPDEEPATDVSDASTATAGESA